MNQIMHNVWAFYMIVSPLHTRDKRDARDLIQDNWANHLIMVGDSQEVETLPPGMHRQFFRGKNTIWCVRVGMDISQEEGPL